MKREGEKKIKREGEKEKKRAREKGRKRDSNLTLPQKYRAEFFFNKEFQIR